jgi:hypothetical protein
MYFGPFILFYNIVNQSTFMSVKTYDESCVMSSKYSVRYKLDFYMVVVVVLSILNGVIAFKLYNPDICLQPFENAELSFLSFHLV